MEENYENDDFQHGIKAGAGNADKEMYEGYLSNQVSFEYFQEKIAGKKSEHIALQDELMQTRREQEKLFGEWQQHATAAEVAENKLQRIADERQQLAQKASDLENQYKTRTSPYALFAGILYLISGIAFVAGDLIITHEIVAYALNIRNNVEAWIFAIGLASLSILLKPAYERLIEIPYLANKSEKAGRVYSYFQIVIVVFSIATMTILGLFRYEAYKTDKLKDSINKQIAAIQLNAQPVDPTQPVDNQALIQEMDAKLQIFENLNLSLVNSPWGLLSFVLSGVLFAVAGAICLGIAFPVLQTYWYRWLQLRPAIKRLNKQQKASEDAFENMENQWAEASKQQKIVKNALDNLPDKEVLNSQMAVLAESIEELQNKRKTADIDRRIYTYSNGYEMGKSGWGASFQKEDFRNGQLN